MLITHLFTEFTNPLVKEWWMNNAVTLEDPAHHLRWDEKEPPETAQSQTPEVHLILPDKALLSKIRNVQNFTESYFLNL